MRFIENLPVISGFPAAASDDHGALKIGDVLIGLDGILAPSFEGAIVWRPTFDSLPTGDASKPMSTITNLHARDHLMQRLGIRLITGRFSDEAHVHGKLAFTGWGPSLQRTPEVAWPFVGLSDQRH